MRHLSEEGREAQRRCGRRAVTSGQLLSASALARTPEHQSRAGKAAGQKAVETGQLETIRNLPQTKAGQSRAGKANGRKAVETGQHRRAASLGGKEQGTRNAETGWMAHVQRMRHNNGHEDCFYCNNRKAKELQNTADAVEELVSEPDSSR